MVHRLLRYGLELHPRPFVLTEMPKAEALIGAANDGLLFLCPRAQIKEKSLPSIEEVMRARTVAASNKLPKKQTSDVFCAETVPVGDKLRLCVWAIVPPMPEKKSKKEGVEFEPTPAQERLFEMFDLVCNIQVSVKC